MTKWLALLMISVAAYGQQNNLSPIPDCSLGFCAGNGVPTFACVAGQKFTRVDLPGNNYSCTGFPPHWVADVGNSSSGAVSSVFTRVGVVAAANGDYTAAQVTNAADLSASSNIFTGSITGNTGLKVGTGSNQYSLLAPGGGVFELFNSTNTAALGLLPGSITTFSLNATNPPATAADFVAIVGASGLPVATGAEKIETNSANFLDSANTLEWQSLIQVGTGSIPIKLAQGDVTTVIKNTNIKLQGITTLAADPTVALGAATKQYVDAHSGGGGGGVIYTSPTVNFVPVVSNATSPGTVINSAFSDDGASTFDAEDFHLNGSMYVAPEAVAVSGSNSQSNFLQYITSYWNGTAAVSTNWVTFADVGTGSTPTTDLDFYGPPDLPIDTVNFGVNRSVQATSGTNYNTPKLKLRGSTWTGSAPQVDDWSIQGVQGTGANPSSTLTIAHVGSTGQASVSMPSLQIVSGVPGIGNNGSQWTGVSSLPGTCTIGDFVTNTAASSSATVMYVCYPANTWTALGASGSSMTGTPGHTADSGAGTSPTITFSTGATDGRGWVTLVEGTSPTASAGVITVTFGGTYGTIPVCAVEPANANAAALANAAQPYVSSAASTTALFVITGGSTVLTAGTTYVWRWGCAL